MKKHNQPKYTKRGITLLELLITVSILAVLAAIITPIYINMLDSSRRVKCAHHLKTIGDAVIAYEFENGVLPGPLEANGTYPSNLHEFLQDAGYDIGEDLWLCPANRGVRGRSVLAEDTTYIVNNTRNTSPSYFFGERSFPRTLSLDTILGENPDGVWLIRDHDVFTRGVGSPQDGMTFDPIGSPGLSKFQKPPHAKGRNYFFADGRVKHIKFGAFPPE